MTSRPVDHDPPCCPSCGRPNSDGALCEECVAPLDAAPVDPLRDAESAAERSRYLRAAFVGCLLLFPLIAWMGWLPAWVLMQLLENGRYQMKWYEWYTLPAQTLAVMAYSIVLFRLQRAARRAERFAAGLCGFCNAPLIAVRGATCPQCGAKLWPYAESGANPQG